MLKPILKNDGVNESERQLSKLLNDTFLSLWSYMGPYSDEGTAKNKQGKEICDALVVFGNKVIIFSDKERKFNEEKSTEVAWKRWYRRSVSDSVRQLHAAESWIRNYPDRVFLDNFCQEKFPLDLNDKNLEIHLIAITKNTLEPAKKYFDNIKFGSTGTLAYSYALKGDISENPFFICDIDHKKTFVHVFDEISIKLVMNELNTISDFINYLEVKEKLIRNNGLNFVYGEEDLLGYYLDNKRELGKAEFNYPNTNCEDNLNIIEGYWISFKKSEKFKIHNNFKNKSIYWSELAARLSDSVVSGNVGEGEDLSLNKHEVVLRSMTSENMLNRAYLGDYFLDKLDKVPYNKRSARVIRIFSQINKFYIFLFLPFERNESVEDYSKRRNYMAESYGLVLKYREQTAKLITVIVTQPKKSYYRSEAIYLYDFSRELNLIEKKSAEKLMKESAILKEFIEYTNPNKDYESKLKTKWGRNDPCHCGSKKKYKKCCLQNDELYGSNYT